MPPKLRYEFYLPTYYNDHTPVEPHKYREVKNEITQKFGAISTHPASVQGVWINPSDNKTHYDNCFRYEITVEKDPANQEFFEKFKQRLKKKFQQFEIYMLCTEVNVV